MACDANGPDGAGRRDEERLVEISTSLADRVEELVPAWIEGLVVERVLAWQGSVPTSVAEDASRAGASARAELMPVLRELLGADVDHQAANPLELLRAVTGYADEVLERAGVPPVARDAFARESRPADRYDLAPATWADIHPDLHELGITWGAAKAFVHRSRHAKR